MSAATAATAAIKDKPKEGASTRFAKDQLKAIIERIEHLEEEKKAISDDIRDVYAEAKGNGYDVTALRTVIRLRKQDKDERAEQEAILETYIHALSMILDLPKPSIDYISISQILVLLYLTLWSYKTVICCCKNITTS